MKTRRRPLRISRGSISAAGADANRARREEFSAARLAGAIGQARIIGEDGADAREQGVGGVAQVLDCLARCFARDRSGRAGALGDLAVERERAFQGDEGKAGSNPFGEIFVQLAGVLLRECLPSLRFLPVLLLRNPRLILWDWGPSSRRPRA